MGSQLPKATAPRSSATRSYYQPGRSMLTTSLLYGVPEESSLFAVQRFLGRVRESHQPHPYSPTPPCCRRNRPGDREKALAVLLPLVRLEGSVAPDLYCMCGRVYKDMFFSSGFQDIKYLEQAYHW